VSQKKLAHFPPVSEHRIAVLSQIMIMLVENYVDWMLRAKIYKRRKDKMYPAFIYVLKFMLDDGSL